MSQFNWRDFLDEAIKNSRPRPKFDESRSTEFNDWKSNYMWTQKKEDTETPKFKKVKQLLIDNGEVIPIVTLRYKVWYQVYTNDLTAFGFSVVEGIITDAPDWSWKGISLSEAKKSIFIEGAYKEVVKICEQILL